MRLRSICLILLLLSSLAINAQKFITSGTIEFEVKTNQKKQLESVFSDDSWFKDMIDNMPQFKVNYYKFYFDNNKASYKFDRTGDTKKSMSWFDDSNEDDYWYNDYQNRKFVNQKTIDNSYIISGDLKKMKWKLYPNETTVIAGLNCRKASTVIFDSVYVFAYYTDEVAVSGGPMSLNGLPGMIMGVTIPRMYTSWIATSITLGNPEVKEPTKGKKKTEAELMQVLTESAKSRAKEWKDASKWMNPMIWRTFL